MAATRKTKTGILDTPSELEASKKKAAKMLQATIPVDQWVAMAPRTPTEIEFYRRRLAELETGAATGWPKRARLRWTSAPKSSSK